MTTPLQTLPDRPWLSTSEVCAYLGCHRRTVDGMRRRGELFARPAGNGELHKSWRYRRLDVLRLAGVHVDEPPTPTAQTERARIVAYLRLSARLHRQVALANDELAKALGGDDAGRPGDGPEGTKT